MDGARNVRAHCQSVVGQTPLCEVLRPQEDPELCELCLVERIHKLPGLVHRIVHGRNARAVGTGEQGGCEGRWHVGRQRACDLLQNLARVL
eukprot:3130698-Prymnesium_polylepis.2